MGLSNDTSLPIDVLIYLGASHDMPRLPVADWKSPQCLISAYVSSREEPDSSIRRQLNWLKMVDGRLLVCQLKDEIGFISPDAWVAIATNRQSESIDQAGACVGVCVMHGNTSDDEYFQ